jgi:hypothetical protein
MHSFEGTPIMNRTRACAALVVAAVVLAGACRGRTSGDAASPGGASPSSRAEVPPLPPFVGGQPAPMQLTPLGDDDVRLYLDVMEAAADRVVHPTAGDQKVTAQANKAMMNAKPGQALPPDDGRAMIRFTTMMTNMDLIIAEERRVDLKRYEGIRAIVEDVVSNPSAASAVAAARGVTSAARAGASADPRVRAAEKAAAKVLAPHEPRIQQLEAIVRKSGSIAR